ncbi:MAG TPA: hypothetical protein VFV49_12380, partial [Thermoanaerobaculia bacterium]|nr:hypothetical protein [Thermoanaerobaculia bacterium]
MTKLKIENGKLKNRTVKARADLSIFNFQFSIHQALLIALALLSLTCANRRSATTTIEFWGLGREGEVVIELLPQ